MDDESADSNDYECRPCFGLCGILEVSLKAESRRFEVRGASEGQYSRGNSLACSSGYDQYHLNVVALVPPKSES